MNISAEIQSELTRRLDAVEGLLPELRRLLTTLQEEDLQIRTKSSRRDLVTKADVASEEVILRLVKTLFPGDGILAEESGTHHGGGPEGATEFSWCIDPIDGTVNYAHGLPLYGVSLGLLYRDEPAAGLIFLPALADTYRAVSGLGATKNGRPIHVSPSTELETSLIVTGFPYNRGEMLDQLSASIHEVLASAHCVRRTGAASVDLCWVAEGRFDGYYEWKLAPWDTSAGIVIVTEAGGRVTTIENGPYHITDGSIVATNGNIHDALLGTLERGLRRASPPGTTIRTASR